MVNESALLEFLLLSETSCVIIAFCVYVFVLFPPVARAYFTNGLWAAE
jgi:hypothetical protein